MPIGLSKIFTVQIRLHIGVKKIKNECIRISSLTCDFLQFQTESSE